MDCQLQRSGTIPNGNELRLLISSTSHAKFGQTFATNKSLPPTPKGVALRHGWRFAAVNYAIAVTIIFICNLVATAWGTHRSTGQELIFADECEKVNCLNTWLHFIINLLSTILLSASNYCMQCLSAPTRSEVDRAHAKGVWLDIGVPSTRNLRFISKRRVVVWALLGLTSVPLHLFYNSMVYSSIASHEYIAVNVPEAFIMDQNCLHCDDHDVFEDSPLKDEVLDFHRKNIKSAIIDLHRKARNIQLTCLHPKECIKEYATNIQSFRRNVLLVGSDNSFPPIAHKAAPYMEQALFNGTRVYGIFEAGYLDLRYGSYEWICQNSNMSIVPRGWCESHVDDVMARDSWKVNGFPVKYCLSETAPALCKLRIYLPVGWLVTSLNLLKALLICYTVFRIKEDPIMTIGDAVTSFLESPDPTTKGSCLLTMKQVKKQSSQRAPERWRAKVYRWKDVTSKTRKLTTISMLVICLSAVSILLGIGVETIRLKGKSTSLQALAKTGFGTLNQQTIIKWKISSTIVNIVMVNLAQPILSLLYFSYNGLFTCMLLGFEWSQYAHTRKGLRVSRGRSGAQRSTYFLQLPYRFSIPLVGLSGLLHWLVSQSIFLVAVDYYNIVGKPSSNGRLMSCGYSAISMVCVLVLGILMVIASIGFGYIPYAPGMNLVGSCSAAMSAACHSAKWDPADGHKTARSKLKWGVVDVGEDGVGHCAFSMRKVRFPKHGKVYA